MAPLPEQLASVLLTGTHAAVGACLKQVGFTWELRRSGDVQIGLWKYSFHRGEKKRRAASFRSQLKAVWVPGFGDTPLTWILVFLLSKTELEQKFDEVILVDFPGFRGGLSRAKCVKSMDTLLAIMHDVFDSLAPDLLLGHSLGGWISAHYAAACGAGGRPKRLGGGDVVDPERSLQYHGPKTLVLINPSGVCGCEKEWENWKNLFYRASRGELSLRDRLFAKEPFWFKWIVPEFSKFMLRDDIGEFVRSFRGDHRLESVLDRIPSSVFLIWGKEDKLVPSRWSKKWLKLLGSKATLQMLRGVGHTPQIECPRLLAAKLKAVVLSEAQGNRIPNSKPKRGLFERVFSETKAGEPSASRGEARRMPLQ